MIPSVVTGARAKVMVGTRLIGILNNVSYNLVYDTQDAYILGRLGPAEIGYTAVEPVSGSMGGWKVIDHGAYAEMGMPHVQDLLMADYTLIVLEDRLTLKIIAKIKDVRLLGLSSGTAARQMVESSVPFKGMAFGDDSGMNSEAADAMALP